MFGFHSLVYFTVQVSSLRPSLDGIQHWRWGRSAFILYNKSSVVAIMASPIHSSADVAIVKVSKSLFIHMMA